MNIDAQSDAVFDAWLNGNLEAASVSLATLRPWWAVAVVAEVTSRLRNGYDDRTMARWLAFLAAVPDVMRRRQARSTYKARIARGQG